MIPEHITKLAEKYLQGTATSEEKQILHQWFDETNPGDTEIVVTPSPITTEAFGAQTFTELMAIIQQDKEVKSEKRRYILPYWRMAAAAVFILIAGVSAYFIFEGQKVETTTALQSAPPVQADLKPGGNIAVLTLSDGSAIVLDSAGTGTISQQGGTQVVKMADGQLAYKDAVGTSNKVMYNTLSTPKGGQYQLTLPDGSLVWLNAASSITFPTQFTGNERSVTLDGEAYFEVATNAKMPFVVQTDEKKVMVLGTQFNVNAYKEEPVFKTTLLEGSVAVSNATGEVKLVPGQEASIHPATKNIKLAPADVEQAIAWKNGLFSFYNADLKTVMRQVARWYDVEVVYEGEPSGQRFVGEVPRNSKASEVLKILELSNVNYRIEGKKIIVTP